jgi:hypothetical protein
MKFPRRTFLGVVAGAAVLSAAIRHARAEIYPSRWIGPSRSFPRNSVKACFVGSMYLIILCRATIQITSLL